MPQTAIWTTNYPCICQVRYSFPTQMECIITKLLLHELEMSQWKRAGNVKKNPTAECCPFLQGDTTTVRHQSIFRNSRFIRFNTSRTHSVSCCWISSSLTEKKTQQSTNLSFTVADESVVQNTTLISFAMPRSWWSLKQFFDKAAFSPWN